MKLERSGITFLFQFFSNNQGMWAFIFRASLLCRIFKDISYAWLCAERSIIFVDLVISWMYIVCLCIEACHKCIVFLKLAFPVLLIVSIHKLDECLKLSGFFLH